MQETVCMTLCQNIAASSSGRKSKFPHFRERERERERERKERQGVREDEYATSASYVIPR